VVVDEVKLMVRLGLFNCWSGLSHSISCSIQLPKLSYTKNLLLGSFIPQLKMNSTNAQCLITTPEHPPTTSPWCAIPVGTNSSLSSKLQFCCSGAPVAVYDTINGPPNCWQYCNITEYAFANNLTLLDCLTSTAHVCCSLWS
jgi:hypothetical protein